MSDRKTQSAGMLGMVLLIALAAVAVVVGLGSGSLSFEAGIAETTDFTLDWDCSWTNDDGVVTDASHCGGLGAEPPGDDARDPDNYDWPNFNDWDHPRKDVGSCFASIPVVTPDQDDLPATVTIGNAYPSYECTFTFVVSNSGTLPFNIDGYDSSVASPLELLNDTCTTTEETNGTPENGSVTLDGGEQATVECTIHIMQEARQDDRYTFTITACSSPCGDTLIQGLSRLRLWRGAPASIGLSITSQALD